MKIKILFISLICFLVASPALATFPNVVISNDDLCLTITGDAQNGNYGEVIYTPDPWWDTDFHITGFPINGGNCDGNGDIATQTVASITDGSYTMTGVTSGETTFYVINGIWSLTNDDPIITAPTASTTYHTYQGIQIQSLNPFYLILFFAIFSAVWIYAGKILLWVYKILTRF